MAVLVLTTATEKGSVLNVLKIVAITVTTTDASELASGTANFLAIGR